MDKMLNFTDALQLASILDKKELMDINETTTVDRFIMVLFDTVSEVELAKLMDLLQVDYAKLTYDEATHKLVEGLIKNNFFQLMEVYRQMGYK